MEQEHELFEFVKRDDFYNSKVIIDRMINELESVDVYNDDGYTPFHIALKNGNADLAAALFSGGADLNKTNVRTGANHDIETPLHMTIGCKNDKMVQVLFKMNDTVDVERQEGVKIKNKEGIVTSPSAIQYAIIRNNPVAIRTLVENHARVDTVDEKGNTLLHLAAQHCNSDTLQYLLGIDRLKKLASVRNAQGKLYTDFI